MYFSAIITLQADATTLAEVRNFVETANKHLPKDTPLLDGAHLEVEGLAARLSEKATLEELEAFTLKALETLPGETLVVNGEELCVDLEAKEVEEIFCGSCTADKEDILVTLHHCQ